MAKTFKIAVSGKPGSGKGTFGRALAAALNECGLYCEFTSMGDINRENAARRKLDFETDWGKFVQANPEIDRVIDGDIVKLLRGQKNVVLDARLAPFFARTLSGVFSIRVDAPDDVRWSRISNRDKKTYLETIVAVSGPQGREEQDRERFRSLYGVVDYLDDKYFDLILNNCQQATIEGLTVQAVTAIKAWTARQ